MTPSLPLTRRRLLGTGLLAVGTATLVGAPAAQAAPVAVWGLDPAGGHETCGCSACAACVAHAANKIFASAAEADTGRAHPHCKCAVTQLGTVESHVYEALFTSGGHRASVDRRRQWVQAALASTAPVPSPGPTPSTPAATPATPTATAAPPPSDAAAQPAATASGAAAHACTAGGTTMIVLRAAWIRRLAPRRRVLFVQIDASRPVAADITLRRRRRSLARRRVAAVSGRQTLRVPLPVEVTRGPAQLRIRFTDADRTAGTATRLLSVPAKLPRTR